jgi:sarcosine oxidase, subunit gamma
MADTMPAARSPLSHFPDAARVAPASAVSLRETPLRGLVNLRIDPSNATARAAAEAAVGIALPVQPNHAIDGAGRSVLWLGPDEYLVVTEAGSEAGLAESLRQALRDHHAAVTDVSDGRTTIEIAGRHARDVIAKGCGLDLHPRVFGPGRCAQTGLAKARVILRQTDPAPVFEIFVERSHAEYLWLWLKDATREFDRTATA